jgi:hypothetical protein
MPKKRSFTVNLQGDIFLDADNLNVFQLPGLSVRVGLDLEDAVRNRKAFDDAARIIGQRVMEEGVRYAARGARKWRKT